MKFTIDEFGHIFNISLAKGAGLSAIDNMITTVVNNINTVPQDLLPNLRQQFVINIVKN